MRGLRLGLMAAVLAPFFGGAALADLVVIRAQGDGLKAGQTVKTGAMVTLPAGAGATLLSQAGITITLSGPYNGVPEAAGAPAGDPKVASALSRLLTSGSADTASLGVSRGVRSRDPYAIDRSGGAHCQVADQPPVFKRAMAIGTARLGLTSAAGTEAAVEWAEGADTAPWPATLPFGEGSYLLQAESQAKPVKLTIHQIPGTLQGAAQIAAWMADHECGPQALALLKSLR